MHLRDSIPIKKQRNRHSQVFFGHYLQSTRIRSFPGLPFPAIKMNAEIYSVNIRIQSICRKIQTEKLRIRTLFKQWDSLFGKLFQNPHEKTSHKILLLIHLSQSSLSIPPENIRKLLVFLMFSGGIDQWNGMG